MSSDATDHFTDMDGQPIEDSLEPLPCRFCGSGADQLVAALLTRRQRDQIEAIETGSAIFAFKSSLCSI